MRKFILLLTLSMLFVPAFAQFTSNVSGTVTDSSGSVVSGAKVTLTKTDTNTSQSFVSNSSGQYYFNRLAPGPYTVTAAAPGFEKTTQAITITTDERLGVDLKLAVGSVADTITVTAEEGHGINAEETRVQYTLSTEEITNFPLQNNATLALLKSAPGATGISENHLNVNINQDTAGEAANGRSTSANIFVLDSIPINSELSPVGGTGGAIDFVPHPDMIQEISLQSSTFNVENGAGSGLQTSITTKSGANKYHGDGDYIYSGQPLEATPHPLTHTPAYRSQQAGGALGGPIWKDRTFFFGSYFNQQHSQTNAQNVVYFNPQFLTWAQNNTAAGRNPDSAINRAVAAATAGLRIKRALPGGDVTGNSLANAPNNGDWIDGYNCNPVLSSAPGFTPPANPVPCDLPVLSTGNFTTPQTANGSQYNFRLDHTLRGGQDRAYLSFFRFDQTSTSRRYTSIFDGKTPSTGYYVAGNYTHTFSSSLLNEASFGQTRFAFDYKTIPTAPGDNSQFLLSGSEYQLELPFSTGPFETQPALNEAFLTSEREHQSYGRDTLTWIKGSHNFTFGFEGSHQDELRDNTIPYARPFYESNYNLQSFLTNAPQYELNFTLSADINNHPGKFVPQVFGAGVIRLAAYVQDSWKVTPNLVINYGFRWDSFGNPFMEGKNAEHFANVKYAGPGQLQEQIAQLSVGKVNNVYSSARDKNFLPRASFAYTLPGNGRKTVVHGGFGFYQDDLNLEQICEQIPTQAPVRFSLTQYLWGADPYTFGNSTVQGPGGGNPYGFVFPSITVSGYDKKGAPIASIQNQGNGNWVALASDLYGVDPNMKPQSVILFNGGAERDMPYHLVLGVTFAGSHGYDQLVSGDMNTYPGRTIPATANPVYNTDFGKIKMFRNSGVSNYKAMILTARQSIGGLSYQASYTVSRAKADPTQNLTDMYDIHSQYTTAGGDTRNRFTLTQSYQLPNHFNNKIANWAVSGWELTNTFVAQGGTPFSEQVNNSNASMSFDYNNDGDLNDIPVYTGKKHSFSRSDARKSINTGASLFNLATDFAAPAPGTAGGLQNQFRGPGYADLDTGITKKVAIPLFGGEKASFLLRLQSTNVLNIANFGNPDGEFSDSTAGVVQSAWNPRTVQFGGRFQF